MLCEPCPEVLGLRHSKPKERLGPFGGDSPPTTPLEAILVNCLPTTAGGLEGAQSRYQGIADTIVQLSSFQASVLIARTGQIPSKCS